MATHGAQTDSPPPLPATVSKAAVTPVQWDGKRFNGWRELRSHLRTRGISGNDFLRNHPAIAASLALPALQWDGQKFFIRSSFVSWLRGRGAGYRIWAVRHPQAALLLTR